MMSKIRHAVLTALALLVLVAPLSAQTVVTSTTLSGAVNTTSETSVTVASATNVLAPATGGVYTYLYVDNEMMQVLAVSGTTARVARGVNSTRASTHITAATVWVGLAGAFRSGANASAPVGQCLRSSLQFVPAILVGGVNNGKFYDCLGVTTAGQWTLVSEPGPQILGSTVASVAGVITATGTVFTVSGTAAITGITLPAGWAVGMSLYITPSAIFTWTAATNIALAGTAVVNKMLVFTWNGAKWVPSYIA